MLRLLWIASTRVAIVLRTWLPSNIVLDLIRTRPGLKFGVPAMLLAVPYFSLAYWCTTLIDSGGPGWLHLIVLVAVWSGLKFLLMGPVSLVLLARAKATEWAHARRHVELAR